MGNLRPELAQQNVSLVDALTGESAEVTPTRELRVTSETISGDPAIADKLYISESYTTTDSFANARPVNGDFNVRKFKSKTLRIKNTGGNIASLVISASIDDGVNYDFLVVAVTTLSPGDSTEVYEDRAYTHLRVTAKSKVAGQPTTLTSKGYALAA